MAKGPEKGVRLLNRERPPVFCAGCGHANVVRSLERALLTMGLAGAEVTMVSDIGCSGLFDTFFQTHAFHGLHGRVLTYATGIKLAQPEQTVVATMGDGGVGIGGAHLLAACRRNLDVTLLILDNFNFGMTGGQYSFTTPSDAQVGSGFLNQLEPPMDVPRVLAAAGAPYVARCSTYDRELPEKLAAAIRYPGFAVVEILGICPGRYTQRNRITPKTIEATLSGLAVFDGEVEANRRPEYGEAYRRVVHGKPIFAPAGQVGAQFAPITDQRTEVLVLGAAGQRVNTAGELLALAGMSAGLNVTQKSEYDITVLRGPSIAELIFSPAPIEYTGLEQPALVLVLADEGVARRKALLESLGEVALVFCVEGVRLPETSASVRFVELEAMGIGKGDRALGMVAVVAAQGLAVSTEMLDFAVASRFSGAALTQAKNVVRRVRDSLAS